MAAAVGGTVGVILNSNNAERWYFTAKELANTASRACGIEPDKELAHRQHTANLIQDMGQRLHVNQLCINTAIVYMHRFYRFHSFTKFNRNDISQCALFLAAKVEEQPRKLEHVIKCAKAVLCKGSPPLDPQSEEYQTFAAELVANENLMLQTLGFDIGIDHPHTHVVKCCQLVKASKELAQTSYFLATNTLHFTTMCLQYKPTVVACLCIHLACKWTSWQIPPSSEGKEWFSYIDETVTNQLLEELVNEFLACLDKCPEKMRNRILSCIKSKDGLQSVPGQTNMGHRGSSSNSHSSQPPLSQHHRNDGLNGAGGQRPDSNRGRAGHLHQPDSTTFNNDRRKTLPANLQQSSHAQRQPSHHTHPSNMASDRYSYNKEHQRQPPPSSNLQGRHSLPPKSNQQPGMLHPKKQYQQQHYMGGSQAQQDNNKNRENRSNGAPPPPPQLVDQSRRTEQMKLDQNASLGPVLNTQPPPKLEIKHQIGNSSNAGRLAQPTDEPSGLLKPADFSQPYPSCASPPAHNPMFEGDSSSMDMDFLAGVGNIVSQTSPNSGSNSGFGGTSQPKLSPPETNHNLSPPPQHFVPSAFGLAAPVIKQEPTFPNIPKQEVPQYQQPNPVGFLEQRPSVQPVVQKPIKPEPPSLPQLPVHTQQAIPDVQTKPVPGLSSHYRSGTEPKLTLNSTPKPMTTSSTLTSVTDSCSTVVDSGQSKLSETVPLEKKPFIDEGLSKGETMHTEVDGLKKHKKKKEKKEKKEKRHKEEKKKKKKKDKDHTHSPSRSPPPPVVQLSGTKLKIKLIPPKAAVTGSDSDSNAGGTVLGADNLKIKIPKDKFEGGSSKEKRKRAKDDFDEGVSAKSRKFH